ncbi:polyhydroxyalkanoate synthesis repressor PhaR [Erythrobacter litoralis]|uniref:polyhydroxyalkanoate synthesis repressor PhaR n=1 Tax=Erythrobacter litoralis TaxID=39960 RepID=UPI002435C5FE|nr:polyhydroxyalkanoate synthesis repressor PhaR [Erythrobacter litoralis]MDG6078150.1 polyhydroxyalkanoate synthesis repressor PhaR [Erythrobacter litoralis]
MARKTAEGEPIIIKKYANRRLYNTDTSSYITLDDLAEMVRENVDFQVLDAKTGDDITHTILTQIIVEEEASGGSQMLPVSFLRDLIGMYGNSMSSMMPTYLEASMIAFRKNREQLQEVFQTGMGANPFTAMAETNLRMMRSAAQAFMPGTMPKTSQDGEGAEIKADDLSEMRAQLAAMQKKLDELGK